MDINEKYSQVVCKGDLGGGLMIPQTKDGEKRYYLQGVASISPRTLDGATNFYALFTNVQDYKDLVLEAVNKNCP